VVSFTRAAAGTAAVLAAFIFGVWFGISQRPLLRYELHLDSRTSDAVRLDKVTGTIHVVTAAGIADLPESLPPKPTPTMVPFSTPR